MNYGNLEELIIAIIKHYLYDWHSIWNYNFVISVEGLIALV